MALIWPAPAIPDLFPFPHLHPHPLSTLLQSFQVWLYYHGVKSSEPSDSRSAAVNPINFHLNGNTATWDEICTLLNTYIPNGYSPIMHIPFKGHKLDCPNCLVLQKLIAQGD